jgi:hypothetical protein
VTVYAEGIGLMRGTVDGQCASNSLKTLKRQMLILSFSFRSVLQIHSLFQNTFSTKRAIVLPLPISSILLRLE